MGLVHGDFAFVNLFTGQRVQVRALVDTGATEAFVTPDVARQLGFDIEEVSRKTVTLADGRRSEVPSIRPIEIHFEERCCSSDVLVLGDECLIGVVPLQLMDLVVDPTTHRLLGKPRRVRGPL